MKQIKVFAIFFCLLVGCLFLAGGSRLVSDEEDTKPHAAAEFPAVVSCLTAAPCPETEASGFAREAVRSVERAVAPENSESLARKASLPSVTDSNGNILTDASYMEAVYQCFAPEEGFA